MYTVYFLLGDGTKLTVLLDSDYISINHDIPRYIRDNNLDVIDYDFESEE